MGSGDGLFAVVVEVEVMVLSELNVVSLGRRDGFTVVAVDGVAEAADCWRGSGSSCVALI